MSQISLKSISGITSITTPAGVDNQFTLHTNNTSQALKLDSAGNIHIHNHINTTGVSTASNFKTGTSNLHSAGLNAAYVDVDDFVDVGSNIKLGNAGVITATSYRGDGSQLTGIVADKIFEGNTEVETIDTGSDGHVKITTEGTERLRIDSNGNARLGPGGNNTNSTNYTTLTISNTAGGVVEFLDSGNNNIAGDIIGAEGSGMYISSKQDTPIIFRTGASNSEKVRIGSAGQLGIAGANYGTSGQVLTSQGSSSAPTWTTVSGTTINNNADNRVITGSGTANTLEGESQFTYDGTTVKNLISVSGSVPTILEVRNTASTWGGGFKFSSNNTYGAFYITNNAGGSSVGLYNSTGGWHWGSNMQFHGGVSPWTDNTHDLGSSSKRWRNLYTTDLQLSNKGKTNDVDGTWGDWTLQEGESKIFMINNRTGKKYSLKMEEE